MTHKASLQHRTRCTGKEVGRRNKIKQPVYFKKKIKLNSSGTTVKHVKLMATEVFN